MVIHHFGAETQGCQGLVDQNDLGEARPLSVSFLFRTSGKETEVATPLDMEKYGRVIFPP